MNSSMNKTSAGKLLIDLTPLLDVVLILLVAVLYLNPANADSESDYEQTTDAQEVVAETDVSSNDEMVDYEGLYKVTANTLQGYENMSQYVNIISFYVKYDPGYRYKRWIYVYINNESLYGNTPKMVTPDNEDTIWDEVKEDIENRLSDTNLPTVVSIDNAQLEEDAKMLYRDEQRLLQLYEDLSFDIKCPGYNTEIYYE